MTLAAMTTAVGDASKKIDFKRPSITWTALIGAISAITATKQDFTDLLGAVVGLKVYILAHWFAVACVAIAANGDLHREKDPNAGE